MRRSTLLVQDFRLGCHPELPKESSRMHEHTRMVRLSARSVDPGSVLCGDWFAVMLVPGAGGQVAEPGCTA